MVDHTQVKLGKLPHRVDERTLKMAKYLAAELPAPPVAVDWLGRQTAWGMMGNDVLGDCAWAAVGHIIQLWSLNDPEGLEPGQKMVTVEDLVIKARYEACCGYQDGQPQTDQGCVELDVLTYWRANPTEAHQLLAFVQVDHTNLEHVKQAMQLFGGIYTGFQLPQSAQGQMSWAVVGDPKDLQSPAAPGSWGGHAMAAGRYNDTTEQMTMITWGENMEMTYEFFSTYCDECWALLGGWWVRPSHAAAGFQYDVLAQDLATLDQTV